MIAYKNMKTMVLSPGGDTDYVNKTVGVLQEDIWALYFFLYSALITYFELK